MRRRRTAVAVVFAAACLPVAASAAPTATPNDPYFAVQWALHGSPASTRANETWCASTGSGVLVADIDTGVDLTHPDLQGGALVAGAAFTSGTSSPSDPQPDATGEQAVSDDYGHGTMTTGIVVARTGNGVGIAGEAPAARALVIKVFANQGSNGYGAYTSDVDSAIVWAVQHGARVINLSLGPNVPLVSDALGDQTPQWVRWAAQNGAAVAIAAGNSSIPAADYLSIENDGLVVGALAASGGVASYSQRGVGVNIYAPGGDGPGGDPRSDVISTFPTYALPPANQPLTANVATGYAAYDGTSFATPYTAGVLALLMADGYSAAQARQRVLDTASGAGGTHPSVSAAAALGGCAAGSGAGPVAGSGHSTTFTVASSAPATHAATPSATPAQTRPEATGGPAQALDAPPGTASPPTQPSGGSGGHPNTALLVALGLLVVGGAPAAVALRRRLR